MSIRIAAFGMSDRGRVRSRNEDAMVVEPGRGLVVVADGMGGAAAGDVASALAVQEVARALHGGASMAEALRVANARILREAALREEWRGMGCTLTALQVDPATSRYLVGHVGDSRAYLRSGDDFRRLTRDHTLVQAWIDEGRLPPDADRNHPLSHILSRAVGVEEELEVDLVEGEARPGDRFLLCSDGLLRVMQDEEIGAWLGELEVATLEDRVRALVEEANVRGAPDNVTVAVLLSGPTLH